MTERLQNINVASSELLPTPEEVKRELPLPLSAEEFVFRSRNAVRRILDREDPRLFVVVGPCSIHDPVAAREYAGRLRQLAATNPAAITDILRPQPVFANGQQRGYRIYPGRNRSQFNRLGLLPGDLVTAINGTPLDDASRGMDILQTMNTASAVTMTVERNGQTVQVNVNNAQVAADAAAAAALPEAIPVNEVPDPSGSSAE